MFISPWVLGYLNFTSAAWTSWVGGALAVAVGVAAVPVAISAHRGVAGQH